MALDDTTPFPSRVWESSASTGVGDLTLAGAVLAGFRTLNAAVGTGVVVSYLVAHKTNGQWEAGEGQLTTSTNFQRDTVQENSLGTTATINFAAGGLLFFVTVHNASLSWPNKTETLTNKTIGNSMSYTGAQKGGVTALTSTAASIAINLNNNNHFSHTTSENSTLALPSNPVAGQSGVIVITQGATARTLAYNSFWKFAGGTVPTLTATIGAVDTFAYYVESATRATCNLVKDVK